MSNYKIRVANKGDIKEAQELFFELGYKWACGEKQNPAINECPTVIRGHDYGCMTWSISSEPLYKDHKEITLPELRDMVVLKRNKVGDATHTDGRYSFYVGKDKNYFFSSCDKAWRGTWKNVEILKPIEKKEMKAKEYLKKIGSNEYVLMDGAGYSGQDNWIEIPEGSETFNFYDRKDNLFFLKGTGENALFSNDINDWEWKEWGYIDFDGVVCLWSRHTHPEELPFIDDEPKLDTQMACMEREFERDQCMENARREGLLGDPRIGAPLNTYDEPSVDTYKSEFGIEPPISLNDQYAEIEKVRQSAWQKQEGGSHYKTLKIQPMQYALENKLDYAQANVVKYVTRHADKNGKEDLLKAIHNLELMIEFYYGDEK